jgi:exodeoxyribonuclease V alpha subunit
MFYTPDPADVLEMLEPAPIWTVSYGPGPAPSDALPDENLLTGEIMDVHYRDADSGFFVASLLRGKEIVPVVGTAIFLAAGARVTISGAWTDHPRYGRQFKASSVALIDQGSAMQVLLGSGFLKGVKTAMAERIAHTFGAQTFARLDEALDHPDKLQKVKGIGPKNCLWIVESWRVQRHWAHAALVSVRAGLTMRQAREAYRRFGEQLAKVVADNPYLLTVVSGVTWQRADEIAALAWPGKAKIDHDDARRYGAAVREVLREAYSQGHMALAETDALARAKQLARPTHDGFEGKARARYDQDYLLLQGDWLYLEPYFEIEEETAAGIAQMLQNPGTPVGDWDVIGNNLDQYADFALSPDQVEAVRLALAHRLVVITGGPGCGKTTIVRVIFNIMQAQGLSLTLCAPTGKAARRMTEATGLPSATIHRILGIFDDEEARYSFQTDAVTIDESSMITAALMRRIVKACGERTRLIFVGDVDQLPPVGAGEPFFQLIHSGVVPVARLTVIHRQGKGSGIIVAAHGFNRGLVPDLSSYDDIEIEYASSNAALPTHLLRWVSDLIACGLSIRDIQVLTPLNNHPWGQHALNLRLQERYNPGPFPLKGCPFKPGDKVIHTRNVYDLRGQTVLNGMVGMVEWVASDEEERRMDIRRREEGDDELPLVLDVQFDGELDVTSYTREDLGYLKLAYAISVHRGQGSEFGYVVLALPTTRPDFMLRQLAYTGLTRAKTYCVLISAQSALQAYVQNEERVRRVTFLGDMLRNLQVEPVETLGLSLSKPVPGQVDAQGELNGGVYD